MTSTDKAIRDGCTSATRPARVFTVHGGGIAGCWFPGDPHDEVVSQKSHDHIFAVRLSFGCGYEGLLSDRLTPVQWRAGAIEYRPAGADHRHSTTISSDWVLLRLPDDVFNDLIHSVGPVAPLVPRGAGIVASPDIAAKAASIRYFVAKAVHQPSTIAAAPLLDLAQACLLALAGERRQNVPIKLSPAALRRVLDYIETRLSDPLDIDDLAAVSGKSRFHFAKAFKHATGHSPHAYIVCRRLDHVKRLLSATDKPIADIACLTGFSSQSHLTESLKQMIGVTPLKYREDFRRSPPES